VDIFYNLKQLSLYFNGFIPVLFIRQFVAFQINGFFATLQCTHAKRVDCKAWHVSMFDFKNLGEVIRGNCSGDLLKVI